MARSWVGLTILACLPCIEMLRSREAHNLYVNYQKTQECYECAVLSNKNSCQPRLPPALVRKARLCTSRPRWQRCVLTCMRSIRPKRDYGVSDYFVGCYARALSLIVPPYPLSVGTTHEMIGLFRALDWRPCKADGYGLYRDMYDTYGAPASWQAHRVAHPEAVR